MRTAQIGPDLRLHSYSIIGSFSIDDDDNSNENVTFKMNLSRLFQFAENVKCRQILLKLISKRPHSSLEKERKILSSLVYVLHKIRHSCAITMKKCAKKRDACAKLLFC